MMFGVVVGEDFGFVCGVIYECVIGIFYETFCLYLCQMVDGLGFALSVSVKKCPMMTCICGIRNLQEQRRGLGLGDACVEKRVSPLRCSQEREQLRSK